MNTFLPEGRYIINQGKDYMVFPNGKVLSCQKKCWNGKVYWTKKEIELKSGITKAGYRILSLRKGRSYYLHRLLAEAFIPNPKKLRCVNHLDGNKLNNNLKNLEWCSYRGNALHAFKIGLRKNKPRYGEDNSAHKVNELEVKKIISLKTKQKNLLETARKFGISISQVWSIQKRISWANLKT